MSVSANLAKMRAMRETVSGWGAGLDELRQAIAAKSDQIAEIEMLPVPHEVARQRLDLWLAALSEPVTNFHMGNFAMREHYVAPGVADRQFTAAAIALAAGPVLTKRLDDYYAAQSVPPEIERVATIERLLAERLTLELQEEALIRECEAAGLPFLRRAAADPAVVLADQAALP